MACLSFLKATGHLQFLVVYLQLSTENELSLSLTEKIKDSVSLEKSMKEIEQRYRRIFLDYYE